MTKTNTAPWDYERRPVIVSQIVKLCAKCGKHMADTRNGLRCISCGHDKYYDVFEHMADVFRRGLEAKQVDEARELAAEFLQFNGTTEEQVDAFLALTERPEYQGTFYLDKEPTDDELRAIEREPLIKAHFVEWMDIENEVTPFAPGDSDMPDEGTDNRASTQWREHGYF